MRKLTLGIMLILLITAVSCSSVSELGREQKNIIPITISNNREAEEVILAGESIAFTIESELPAQVSSDEIVWYINGERYNGTGKTITVFTDSEANLQYTAYVEIDTPVFKAKSNCSRCIAVTDMDYRNLALAVYKFVEESREKYNTENIPGLSVSIYGKNGAVDFDLYDGYASISKGIKNTEKPCT